MKNDPMDEEEWELCVLLARAWFGNGHLGDIVSRMGMDAKLMRFELERCLRKEKP